jgi:hypothetical protein
MTVIERVAGVLRLNPAVFEEIEADTHANGQALGVVVAVSVIAALGAGVQDGTPGIVRDIVSAISEWVLWAGVTYIVGSRLLPEPTTRTNMGELLRVMGYAFAPFSFGFLGAVPIAGRVLRFAVEMWVAAAMVIAVRQALDYTSTLRAVAVTLSGYFFFQLLMWGVYAFSGF